MSVRPNAHGLQDMPPKGGYPPFPMKRVMPGRGPSGLVIWGVAIAATLFGLNRIGKTNEENRLLHKEKRECRMAILPYLAAEHDKNLTVVMDAALKQEAEIMKDVEGWKVGESVFSKRWLPPLAVTTVEHRRVLSKYGPAGPGL